MNGVAKQAENEESSLLNDETPKKGEHSPLDKQSEAKNKEDLSEQIDDQLQPTTNFVRQKS